MDGWLTTVVSRLCLDMLRSRARRGEQLRWLEGVDEEPIDDRDVPERDAFLADAVGDALAVVLRALGPAERVAFVLHDMFGVSFDEISPVLHRSPGASRQLASRARRRVQGARESREIDLGQQRAVVKAFLAAARSGDLGGVVAVLDPEVVLRCDAAAVAAGSPALTRGSAAVAAEFTGKAEAARAALVDGSIGVVVDPGGQILVVVKMVISGDRICEIDAIADPVALRQVSIGDLDF